MVCYTLQYLFLTKTSSVTANLRLFTEPLDLEDWGWCVGFGVGELLWGQVSVTFADH